MAKMNHDKQNKYRNGSIDRRDIQKTLGDRWLEKNDPSMKKKPAKPSKNKKPH